LASSEKAPDSWRALDQIEMTPFLQQREARAACKTRGIAVEAHSPSGERGDL